MASLVSQWHDLVQIVYTHPLFPLPATAQQRLEVATSAMFLHIKTQCSARGHNNLLKSD